MTRPGPMGTAATPLGFSDAARRASDAVNLALTADPEGNRGRFLAIRLSDGGTDGVVYDTVAEAALFQLHYKQCMYLRIPASGIMPREAEVLLNYHRRVYDAGNVPPYLEGIQLLIPNSPEMLT